MPGGFRPPKHKGAPTVLDLFCGGGGAAYGYYLAGFNVVGVDNKYQRNYPFKFVLADAFWYLKWHGAKYDVIHASPPCQLFSKVRSLALRSRSLEDLLTPMLEVLDGESRPWIVENTERAPLGEATLLCGTMFGMRTYRHRLFKTNFPVNGLPHAEHVVKSAKYGAPPEPDKFYTIGGHVSDTKYAREVLGTPWMASADLAQAIPPAYTRYIAQYIPGVNHAAKAGWEETPLRPL